MFLQGWTCRVENNALGRELADVPLNPEHGQFIEGVWRAHWPNDDMHKQLRGYGMYLRTMKANSD